MDTPDPKAAVATERQDVWQTADGQPYTTADGEDWLTTEAGEVLDADDGPLAA